MKFYNLKWQIRVNDKGEVVLKDDGFHKDEKVNKINGKILTRLVGRSA